MKINPNDSEKEQFEPNIQLGFRDDAILSQRKIELDFEERMFQRLMNVVSAALAVTIVSYSLLVLYTFFEARVECLRYEDPKEIAAATASCSARKSATEAVNLDESCMIAAGLRPSSCSTDDSSGYGYLRRARDGAVIAASAFVAFTMIVGSLNYIFFESFTLWHRRRNIT